jgi:imidazolonepropionase
MKSSTSRHSYRRGHKAKATTGTPVPLLLINIRQLITLRGASGSPRRGAGLNELGMIEDGAVLCLGGKIVALGRTKDAVRDGWVKSRRAQLIEIDCSNKVVVPGFVDAHTHPAFMAPRLIDFEKRIAGATYEEIAAAGGGIRSSIQSVRGATLSELSDKIVANLNEMAAQGTTTVEAKSGYGLSVESELKSLAAIARARNRWPGTVVSTLLGAHVVPPEYEGRSPAYIEEVCKKMIPQAVRGRLAEFVDVFCDRGAFSAEDAEQVFTAASKHGLGVRAHTGQLSRTRLAPLLRFQPASLDHLDHVEAEDIRFLAESDTVATLVPGANHFLGLSEYPPAQKLIEAGVAVAVATDYNPGSSPTPSMPFVLSLACTRMRMTPAQALCAATVNGAWSLRIAGRKGSIEPGKDADLAVFDVSDYRELAYWIDTNKCFATVLGGKVWHGCRAGEPEGASSRNKSRRSTG